MRGVRHNIVPVTPIGAERARALCAIPGVRLARHHLTVPEHAFPLVDAQLRAWGTRFTDHEVRRGEPAPVLPHGPDPFLDLERLTPEARAKATPFQREGLARFLATGGGIAAWPCGAGKSALGVGFAAGHAGRTLVICPSASVPQWAGELNRWSTLRVYAEVTATTYEAVRVVEKPMPTVRLINREPVRAWAPTDPAGLRLLYLLPVVDHERLGGWALRSDFTAEEWARLQRLVRAEPAAFEVGETVAGIRYEVRSEEGAVVARFGCEEEVEAEACRALLDRGRSLPVDVDVVVIGWALLTRRLGAILEWAPSSIVVDESQRSKDHKRWTAHEQPDGGEPIYERLPTISASAQAACQQAGAVLLLTATPQPDRMRDWWGQLDLLDPFGWGNFHSFALRYCNSHQGQYGWNTEGSSNEEELRSRIAPFLHTVTRAEVQKYLPPLRRDVVTLSLSQLVAVGRSGKDKEVWGELGAFGRGVKGRVQAEIALAAEQKRAWVADRVHTLLGEGAKVVVLTLLRTSCERLGHAIRKANPKMPVWAGHGGDPVTDRRKMLLAYAAHEGPCCLVGTIASWGESLDGLQHTDRAIAAGLPWNHGQLMQMEGRFSRHGGRNVVIEYPIANGTIDEHILRLVLSKLDSALTMLPDTEAERMRGELLQEGKEDELLDELCAALLEHEEEHGFGDGGERGKEVMP